MSIPRCRIFSAFFVVLFIGGCHSEPSASENLFALQVSRADGSTLDLSSLRNNKASVFVFLAPDCPLSRNYTRTLNGLREQFEEDSVGFFGVFPGEWFDSASIVSFADTYRIGFPLLQDRDFQLTRGLGAVVTPEVFVINSAGQTVYQGAIDNWAAALGTHRATVTEHYLRDALTHHLQGEAALVRATEAIGCFIEGIR